MFDTNSSLKNSDKSIKKEELKLTENFVVEFWNHAYIKMEPKWIYINADPLRDIAVSSDL